MARSTYNFNKRNKEKARQQKQMDKAAKRQAAREEKAQRKAGIMDQDAASVEPLQEDRSDDSRE